jgi:hypothetical protein
MPAIGASTTGTVSSMPPILRGFAARDVDTPRLFQTGPLVARERPQLFLSAGGTALVQLSARLVKS